MCGLVVCEKTGKFSFASERAAKKAARNLANANRAGCQKERLHAYRCGGHFHIGHNAWAALSRRSA